jgi:hypothetical protein
MIRRFSLLPKLLTVNALIIVLVAAGGVWAARYFNDTSVIACAVLLGIGGSALSAMTGYAMIKNHFQTLREFRKSVEAIQGGMSSSIAAGSDSDPTIGGVIRSVHDAIGRLEDESLWQTRPARPWPPR